MQIAYDAIAGDEASATWPCANRSEFYRIAARLIPMLVAGQNAGITVIVAWSCGMAALWLDKVLHDLAQNPQCAHE